MRKHRRITHIYMMIYMWYLYSVNYIYMYKNVYKYRFLSLDEVDIIMHFKLYISNISRITFTFMYAISRCFYPK